MTTEYPHFECDIKTSGLTLAKLSDEGNVMTEKFN